MTISIDKLLEKLSRLANGYYILNDKVMEMAVQIEKADITIIELRNEIDEIRREIK